MRNILYFIGAGLTKSLELPGRPVPLMCDYVSVMADYIVDDDVILTGLTALELEEPCPYRWEDLETRDLAQVLSGANANRSSERNRKRFRHALKNRPYESIEDLLERVGSIYAIRFIYAISQLFYRLNFQVLDEANRLENFLERQFQPKETRHVFVSLNYDLILDRAVQRQAFGEWHVCTGYGFQISRHLGSDGFNAQPIAPSHLSSSRFLILKPRGSINWLVPLKVHPEYSTGLPYERGPVVVPLAGTGELTYIKPETFRYVSYQGEPPRDHMPYIIPPTSAKRSDLSFIAETRSKARQAIMEADEVYILGWSMPRTDEDLESMIKSAIEERQHTVERITVVNRGASPDYFERVASVFGVKRSQMRLFNDGFCEFVAESVVTDQLRESRSAGTHEDH